MKTYITIAILCLAAIGCRAEKKHCETCGHYFDKDGFVVQVYDPNNVEQDKRVRTEDYCSKHKPEGSSRYISYGVVRWYGSFPKAAPKYQEPDAWTCHECKHLFKPGTGKDITTAKWNSAHIADSELHFCKLCAPAYDRIVVDDPWEGMKYVKRVPPVEERWVVVGKDGKEPPTVDYILHTNSFQITR